MTSHRWVGKSAPDRPRGNPWSSVDSYRVADGKISDEWAADDVAAIMVQIGAFIPPWAA